MLVGGEFVDAASGKIFETINPATGEVVALVAQGGREDVDRAVHAARTALEGSWRNVGGLERQTLLLALADLIESHADELGMLDTIDMGMPLTKSRVVARSAAADLRAFSALARSVRGATIENATPASMFSCTVKEPVGVVGAITPWNAPTTLATTKIGHAIAAGCTLVFKPAEQAPLAALRIAELCLEAGVPEGVINVVTGDGEAGAALAEHHDVDMVTFTGSVETGQKIIRASAGNVKRLVLELGGKSPDIVFADADLEAAVPGAAMAIFGSTGQACSAGSRLYVQRPVYDEFIAGVCELGARLTVGDPLDPSTDLGPVVSDVQLDRVLGYLAIGRAEGARVLTGGERLTDPDRAAGYFVAPTVFTDVSPEMRIAREEIFGPVVAAIPFDGVEDVLVAANDTTYGLAAGIWSRDVNTVLQLARRLKVGVVWANTYKSFDPAVPFGGYRMSGYGREHGVDGLEEYLSTKSVWIRTA